MPETKSVSSGTTEEETQYLWFDTDDNTIDCDHCYRIVLDLTKTDDGGFVFTIPELIKATADHECRA